MDRVRTMDIVQVASQDERFSTLVQALQEAGLADTLKGKGPFTVLAPTNTAFDKLPRGTMDDLLGDVPRLKRILLYHVIDGRAMSSDVAKMQSAKTMQGSEVRISAQGGRVMINDAQVIQPDIETSNGVIHVIDSVLMPPQK
jgi:transforming growth factor-beta-induced protein